MAYFIQECQVGKTKTLQSIFSEDSLMRSECLVRELCREEGPVLVGNPAWEACSSRQRLRGGRRERPVLAESLQGTRPGPLPPSPSTWLLGAPVYGSEPPTHSPTGTCGDTHSWGTRPGHVDTLRSLLTVTSFRCVFPGPSGGLSGQGSSCGVASMDAPRDLRDRPECPTHRHQDTTEEGQHPAPPHILRVQQSPQIPVNCLDRSLPGIRAKWPMKCRGHGGNGPGQLLRFPLYCPQSKGDPSHSFPPALHTAWAGLPVTARALRDCSEVKAGCSLEARTRHEEAGQELQT